MDEVHEFQLHIKETQQSEAEACLDEATIMAQPPKWSSKQWWIIVVLCIFFILAGQSVATLLGRLYYDGGGNSKWISTLVQSAGFPVLFFPLFFFSSPHAPLQQQQQQPSEKSLHGGAWGGVPRGASPHGRLKSQIYNIFRAKVAAIYIGIGIMAAGDNLMYSYGLLYLPVSTYSLICASQLGFNAAFSYFLNAQKFTPLILNSVVLLTFSAALLGVHPDPGGSSDIPKGKYPLGLVLTVCASATFSLILSLIQLTFQKVLKRETFSVVIEMQIVTSAVASAVCILGLFVSGEWKALRGEMKGFEKGEVSYVMVLVWIAIAWQVASIGTVGLIFVVSSLFSNVISTLGTPVVPIFSVIFLHEKMDGVKIIAMLIAIWGFVSYLYQNYIDENKAKRVLESKDKEMNDVSVT